MVLHLNLIVLKIPSGRDISLSLQIGANKEMLEDVREVTTSLSFSIPVLLLCVASGRILSAVLFHDLSTIIQKSTKLDQTTLYHPTHLQLLFVLRHHGGRHTTVQCKTHHLHVGFLA